MPTHRVHPILNRKGSSGVIRKLDNMLHLLQIAFYQTNIKALIPILSASGYAEARGRWGVILDTISQQ